MNGAIISAAVEGITDEAVALRLIEYVGATPGVIYEGQGIERLRRNIRGYNQAAAHAPWLVLVDLDRKFECAAELRRAWLPADSEKLCFRVAVSSKPELPSGKVAD